MIRKHGGRLRSGAGALVVSVAVVAAVTAGYFGLRHDAALGDAGSGPAARTGAAMAYDPVTADVVMFGGTDAAGQPLAGTWLWNGSGWESASPATSPPARYGAQMAWDPQSQRVILLGGIGGTGCSIDGPPGVAVPGSAGSGSATAGSGSATTGSGSATAASASATRMPISAVTASASATVPPASASATPPSAIAAPSGVCTELQDAWAWDGSDWSRLVLDQASGQLGNYTLAGASMATDAATGKIVLVTADSQAAGGVVIPGIYAGGSATGVASGGSSGGFPASSAGAVTANPGGVCIGVGGGPCGSPVTLPTAPATTVPEPSACPLDGDTGCAPLPCSPCVICPMTSGSTTTGSGAEVTCSNCAEIEAPCPLLPASLTWVFDGSTFQPIGSDPTDAPPSDGHLVWFPGPGHLVDLGSGLYAAMGGTAMACPYGAPCPVIPAREDYQWTGTGWSPVQDVVTGASQPYFEVPPVADTATGEAVGLDATGVTWVSTDPAADWTKAASATAPTARFDFALAYDDATGQVVLFGGDAFGASSATGGVSGDTWTWNSSGWTLRDGTAPTPSPSASGTASPVAGPVTPPSLPLVPPVTPVPAAVTVPGPTTTVPATENAASSAAPTT